MNNKCLKIFFLTSVFVKFRCFLVSDSLEMMAHGRVKAPALPRPGNASRGKWGHWFFPEATALAKRLTAVVCDLRERGWREGILMTWMNKNPRVPLWLGLWVAGFQPTSQHTRVLGSASATRGRSGSFRGENPCCLDSLGDSQGLHPPFPITLGIGSSVSLETHSLTVFQGL